MTVPTPDAGTPAVTTVTAGAPAWLHLVVAWTLALVCVVFVGVLALLHDPIPSPLLLIGGVSVGGALGLTNPLALTRL